MAEPFASVSGPRCALHPERAAAATCERCGNFACRECTAGGVHCPTCRELVGPGGFPLTAENLSIDGLFAACWRAFKQQWAALCATVVVLYFASASSSLLLQIGLQLVEKDRVLGTGLVVVGYAVSVAIQSIGYLVLYRANAEVLMGRKLEFGVLTAQVRKGPRAWAVMLYSALAMIAALVLPALGVGVLLLTTVSGEGDVFQRLTPYWPALVPVTLGLIGVIYLLSVTTYLALMEVAVDDGVSGVEAMRRGWQIARGFRLYPILITVVASVLVMVGLMACCVPVLPAAAFSVLLYSGYHLALRSSAGLQPPGNSGS
jgi:hypothetical protein